MLNYIEYLNVPTKVAIAIVGLFLILQIIGELLEFKGKIVPEFVKVRKYFIRKREERKDTSDTLKAVKKLLNDVNSHYNADNIKKRDKWIKWVNDRAEVYDQSFIDFSGKLNDAIEALKENTKMTEEMFVQSSRDRIINFATKVTNESIIISREEFNRIFKVYDEYELFLKNHNLTNGEVDIAIQVIKESYEEHMKHHRFLEDIRGYK